MKTTLVKLCCAGIAALAVAAICDTRGSVSGARSLPLPHPLYSDALLITSSTVPPTEGQCESVGRRCFTPQSVQSAYDLAPLYAQGLNGAGQTIAIVDSYGSDTIAHDLHVYDQAFGLQPMCGEEGVTCVPGMPTFTRLALQGAPGDESASGNEPWHRPRG